MLDPFLESFQYIAKYTAEVHQAILINHPEIYDGKEPTKICRSIGNSCSPACKIFDPSKSCTFSSISLDYRSFAECLWLFKSLEFKTSQEWELFYGCFHKKKKKDEKGLFTASFPNDIPSISDSMARSNASATKNLKPDDPSKWTEQRVHAVIHGNELERRLASTDWDWNWYTKARAAGHQVTFVQAQNRVILDKILFKVLGKDFESGGTFTFRKTEKEFLKVQTLYTQLAPIIDFKLSFI